MVKEKVDLILSPLNFNGSKKLKFSNLHGDKSRIIFLLVRATEIHKEQFLVFFMAKVSKFFLGQK